MPPNFHQWLARFGLDEFLSTHVASVFTMLPGAVRDDLVQDPSFTLCDYEPVAGGMMQVPVGVPALKKASRSVVLKRTLRHRPESFVCYVIAHELAHAHLRNAGRWPGEDPEYAADALAEQWGFPRPQR